MREHELSSDLWVPRPRDEVFAFFSDAGNLDRITPPWLSFRILSQRPVAMAVGALIDYRLRVRGLPIRWQSEITAWEPPLRFVDEQRRGPYRLWIHEHTFSEQDGGTWIGDRVRYAVPGGPLEPLVHRLLVRRDVERIFDFRRRTLEQLYGANPAGAGARGLAETQSE